MPTKINLSDYYQKYPKKIVDRIFKKFIELNSEESNMYNERFDKILELKNKNPYLSGREYHRLLYGDKLSGHSKIKVYAVPDEHFSVRLKYQVAINCYE